MLFHETAGPGNIFKDVKEMLQEGISVELLQTHPLVSSDPTNPLWCLCMSLPSCAQLQRSLLVFLPSVALCIFNCW